MNRRKEVSEQLRDFCRDNKVDVALIQEPPTSEDEQGVYDFNYGSIRTIMKPGKGDIPPGAAIIIFNPNLKVMTPAYQNINMASALLEDSDGSTICLISMYFKFSMPTIGFVQLLRGNLIDNSNNQVIIGADVNAHSTLWHCPTRDSKGVLIEELIEENLLKVLNIAGMPDTYARRNMGSSNVDVSMITEGLESRMANWNVHLDATDSDHRLITFELVNGTTIRTRQIIGRFQIKKANWSKFTTNLVLLNDEISDTGSIHDRAGKLTEIILKAAINTIPRARKPKASTKPPWWCAALDASKKALNRDRRRAIRLDDIPSWEAYRVSRNHHTKEIRKAKMGSWRTFAEDLNHNTWGNTFKWIKKGKKDRALIALLRKPDGQLTNGADETAEVVLNSFVPQDRDIISTLRINDNLSEELEEASEDELREAIWSMGPNKAPGPDGLQAGILRKAWPVMKYRMMNVFNHALKESTFPDSWKKANLVLISKGKDKDKHEVKSYRPISLLSTLAKALEALIKNRLINEIGNNMSEFQHGFMKGKSTQSAIDSVLDDLDD